MPPRFFAQQISHPRGFVGRVVGHLMNRHNARMNAFAVRQLELAAEDRVLEIGFGGGVALPSLLQACAFVGGVDHSRDAVLWARARFAAEARAGRADFRHGSVDAIPFATASFAKACTVNTVYFWRSLPHGFREIGRVLRNDGRVVVGFLPKAHMDRMGMPADVFVSRSVEDVVAALAATGFRDIRIERPEPATPWNVVVATR